MHSEKSDTTLSFKCVQRRLARNPLKVELRVLVQGTPAERVLRQGERKTRRWDAGNETDSARKNG